MEAVKYPNYLSSEFVSCTAEVNITKQLKLITATEFTLAKKSLPYYLMLHLLPIILPDHEHVDHP